MSLETHYRPISPRLGTHYAIFTSTYISLVLFLLILEQLGARTLWLSHIMMAVPIALYLGIALYNRTLSLRAFHAAGRRIPPVFVGLSLSISALGGIGFFALTGAVYMIGFDALSIVLGMVAGFVVAAVLFAPFLRKSGAFTLPGYFRQRFDSTTIGAIAAVMMVFPLFLLLAAEISLGAMMASLFASVSYETAVTIGAVIVIIAAVAGGLASLIWTQCAQYIVMIAGFMTPIVILSLLITNLPLPQFTYGELFERIATLELAIGISPGESGSLIGLPGDAREPVMKPFLQPFGAIDRTDFILLLLCFLGGSATLPSLLNRAGTAPTVFESRQSWAWGLLFLGIFLISIPAYAAFAKFLTLQDLAGTPASQLPDWIARLREAGLADFTDKNQDGVVSAAELLVSRDGVTLALPIIGNLPFIIVVLVAAGGIAAALAAGASHCLAMGQSIAEDVYRGALHKKATPSRRLLLARLGCIAFIVPVTWFVAAQEIDVLRAAAWAMSLTASAFLPVLVLSIWWKRITLLGAMAGMLAGFGVALAHIALAEMAGGSLLGLSSLLSAVIGVPAGALAAIGVSMIGTPSPERIDFVEQLRDPSGQALYDRAIREEAQKQS